jgi:hypothetical protein
MVRPKGRPVASATLCGSSDPVIRCSVAVPVESTESIRTFREQGVVVTCRLRKIRVGLSFWQSGFPQSLLVQRQIFSAPIRAKHVFEIRNTQRGI